jgi:hypothetical protein
MNRPPLLWLLLTLFAPAGAAQDDWKEFTPPDGSFTVLVPGKPMEFKKSIKTPGGTVDVFLFEVLVTPGDGKFVAGYSEFPEASIKPGTEDKRLDNARDGALASTKGMLVRQKLLLLNHCPGRELLIKIDAKTVALVRLYAVKNRLYQLVVLGSEELVASPQAERFLTSLKLVRERAVARRVPDC